MMLSRLQCLFFDLHFFHVVIGALVSVAKAVGGVVSVLVSQGVRVEAARERAMLLIAK